MSDYQIAIFRNPRVKSKDTANLNFRDGKGGIQCEVIQFPNEPKSKAVIRNGQWEEVPTTEWGSFDNEFVLRIDALDDASSNLISKLRNNKSIAEIGVYESNSTSDQRLYSYYLNKVFIKKANAGTDEEGWKYTELHGVCASFRRRTKNNFEPVLWDSESCEHKYTGTMR